jgi:hypothetical protein
VKALAKVASQRGETNMSQRATYNVQLITENGQWPYVGKAYVNKNGSFNVYLDPGKTIPPGAKLCIRERRQRKAGEATAG